MAEPDLDIVFLLPGFLGLERLRDYAYFGDRFGTALRAALTPRVKPRLVQVVPIPLPPTSALRERQIALSRTLIERTTKIAAARRANVRGIHLVGHSTGGVDAHLLTLERPLSGETWSEDVEQVRSRIKSVISIASPHQGTCLSEDALARLFGSDTPLEVLENAGSAVVEGIAAAAKIVFGLPNLFHDPDAGALIEGVFGTPEGRSFILDIARSRELIEDLRPATAIERYTKLGSPKGVLRRSFVTVAGITPTQERNVVDSVAKERPKLPTADGRAKSAPPDTIFMLLSQATSGRATKCFEKAPLIDDPAKVLNARAATNDGVIAAARSLLPPQFDAAVNDGVVNSVRQLINPKDPDELVAIVVGDHFDVIGHYDRELIVTDPRTGESSPVAKTAGLLHSGSNFRDDEFFELIDRIAVAMLPAFDKTKSA